MLKNCMLLARARMTRNMLGQSETGPAWTMPLDQLALLLPVRHLR